MCETPKSPTNYNLAIVELVMGHELLQPLSLTDLLSPAHREAIGEFCEVLLKLQLFFVAFGCWGWGGLHFGEEAAEEIHHALFALGGQ